MYLKREKKTHDIGNRRIVNLGPQNYGHENLYSYAVVSDGLEASLFVLARDPADFRENYEQTVLVSYPNVTGKKILGQFEIFVFVITFVQTWLKNNGFTQFWNKPEPTYQVSTSKLMCVLAKLRHHVDL